MRRINRLARGHSLVVVISDFREESNWSGALRALGARHDVLAVEVFDPREAELPDVGHLTLVDPRRASASRPTPPAPSCGAGSRPPSWAAATS